MPNGDWSITSLKEWRKLLRRNRRKFAEVGKYFRNEEGRKSSVFQSYAWEYFHNNIDLLKRIIKAGGWDTYCGVSSKQPRPAYTERGCYYAT
ncbi:hypothetical protein [Hymenobacter glacieicola]|uniref:Uncharacterized protein n=1 Tax=Hymenobacter glacieicola TaxID=1562124 RepID=A0ABQ1X8H3_9BACT|nr:hypothetical protein [Hymenobacter glacieicola]GGG60953.1 hypothetical protein GCM10011378_41200 [Hymenobacter glacieicola]